MREIKKLIFRSYYRNIIPIVAVLGVLIFFLAIIIDYENINSHENVELFLIIGILALILFLCVSVVYVSKKRKFDRLKKYIEENSLSYDEEFGKITKHIYVSKDLIIDTYFGSKCAIHLKMIESYKKTVRNVGKNFYTAISFTLKDGLKEETCVCPNKGDYEKLIEYLDKKEIYSHEEASDNEKNVEKKALHQPKSAFGTIAIIIVISLVFGAGYFMLFSSNSAQYSVTDSVLEVVVLNDEYIEVTSTYYEDEEIVYIYNNSPNLLSTDITITNGDKFEDTGKIYIRPYGAYMHFVTDAQDVDEYIFNDYIFFRSKNKANIGYAAYFSENFMDCLDIALYKDDMNEENVRDILNEEKDYVTYADYQTQYYYFYDMDPEVLVSEYPDEGSHTYMGVIDNTSKSIQIYKNVDGDDTIIDTVKY